MASNQSKKTKKSKQKNPTGKTKKTTSKTTKKSPTNKRTKYSHELKSVALALYVKGDSMVSIAKQLDLTGRKVVERWKHAKDPADWDEVKASVNQTTVEKKMNTLAHIFATQDGLHDVITKSLTGQFVNKANRGKVDDEVASKLLLDSMREQKKLHLPLRDQFETKGSIQAFGVGAKTNPNTGENSWMMGMLNTRFEEMNARTDTDRETDPETD